MKGAVREAWEWGIVLSLYEITLPSRESAAEQRAVDVSMRIMSVMIS